MPIDDIRFGHFFDELINSKEQAKVGFLNGSVMYFAGGSRAELLRTIANYIEA